MRSVTVNCRRLALQSRAARAGPWHSQKVCAAEEAVGGDDGRPQETRERHPTDRQRQAGWAISVSVSACFINAYKTTSHNGLFCVLVHRCT